MQRLVQLKTIRDCCLPQDIEHDGKEIPNPRDPPGQRCVYIPPGKNYCFITSSFMFLISNSNLSLYSLYYAEACNEFGRPISASLRLWATQLRFQETSQRWQPEL